MPSLKAAYRNVYQRTRIGDLLRMPARELRVRIRSGPCKGLVMSLPSRARYLRGDYEPDQAAFVQEVLRPGDVFWDVGAHFGYYTLLASRVTGRASGGTGRVYAFEPVPGNLWYLRRHIKWNQMDHAQALPYAIGGADGAAAFRRSGTGSGRLDREGMTVDVRTIDSLVESGRCAAPTCVKMDIEGAEADALAGAAAALSGAPVLLIISLHQPPEIGTRCMATLEGYGYDLHKVRDKGMLIACGPGRPMPRDAIARHIEAEAGAGHSGGFPNRGDRI